MVYQALRLNIFLRDPFRIKRFCVSQYSFQNYCCCLRNCRELLQVPNQNWLFVILTEFPYCEVF